MQNWPQTVISQYANSPTLLALLESIDEWINPDTNFDNFYNLILNIDTAVGYGLDVWGRIVGVSRILKIAAATFFGFTGPPGVSGVPWNQGIFYSGYAPLTQNYTLLDEPYRTLILAKALFNICDATIPAINQILINLFGANGPLPVPGNCYVTDGEDMTMTYTFGAALDPVQAAIVFNSGVLPKPAGVSATVVQL